MTLLVLGLLIFLGVHSVRIVAEPWRAGVIERLGEHKWKALYSLVSVAGFVLLVWGYGLARQAPLVLWQPPPGTRHLASLLTLVAFVLLAAAYVPGNGLKARLRHPMVLAVKVWALAHLLANGTLADLLLFGGFLLWALASYRAARQRDRPAGPMTVAPGRPVGTAVAVAIGVLAWAAFAFWAHAALIGVRPFG